MLITRAAPANLDHLHRDKYNQGDLADENNPVKDEDS